MIFKTNPYFANPSLFMGKIWTLPFLFPKRSTLRTQYLVTYSKANMTKFPTTETFAQAIVNSFILSGKVTVEHWACCLAEHENTSGKCMCVVLLGPKRWNPVKNHLKSNYQIVVNIFESHKTYYTAYKYVCEKDCTLRDSNRIRTRNHLVYKRTLNHLTKLAKPFLKTWDIVPVSSKMFLDIQATVKCRFTLKCVRDIIIYK